MRWATNVVCHALLAAGGCSADDKAGEPTGGSESTAMGGSSDGAVDSSTASTGVADASDEATSETGAPPGIDGIVGEWVSIDTYDPDRPDQLTVRQDGTATGIFRYLVDGSPWEVRLEATVAVGGGAYDLAFVCDDTAPECVALGFESNCELVIEQLICSAPEWYYEPEIVFERVP